MSFQQESPIPMFPLRISKICTIAAIAAFGLAAGAQQKPTPSGPSPVLVTVSEVPQPGAEDEHAALEAQYASVLNANKAAQYYLGMGAITGKPQTLFLSGYASLEQMADVHNFDEFTLGEKLAGLDQQHNELLADANTAIWLFRPMLSNPTPANLAQMRFMEMIHIHVRLGHAAAFAQVTEQMRDAWAKTDPDFHFSVYQQIYGSATDDSYLIVIPVQSLAQIDHHHSLVGKYSQSLDEQAQKQMLDFVRQNYVSTESNLFAFTPAMSRLPASWTKGDTDFWTPQPAATPTKPAAKAN